MAKKTYSEKLRDPRWQKKRLEILGRDGFRCRRCGSPEDMLHVHHGYYERGLDPWEYSDETLISLCEGCHSNTQDELRDLHMELSKIHPADFAGVMQFLLEAQTKGFTANPHLATQGYESWKESDGGR